MSSRPTSYGQSGRQSGRPCLVLVRIFFWGKAMFGERIVIFRVRVIFRGRGLTNGAPLSGASVEFRPVDTTRFFRRMYILLHRRSISVEFLYNRCGSRQSCPRNTFTCEACKIAAWVRSEWFRAEKTITSHTDSKLSSSSACRRVCH